METADLVGTRQAREAAPVWEWAVAGMGTQQITAVPLSDRLYPDVMNFRINCFLLQINLDLLHPCRL